MTEPTPSAQHKLAAERWFNSGWGDDARQKLAQHLAVHFPGYAGRGEAMTDKQPSERAMKVAAQQMPFEAGFAKVSRVRLAVAIDRGLPGYEALLAAVHLLRAAWLKENYTSRAVQHALHESDKAIALAEVTP